MKKIIIIKNKLDSNKSEHNKEIEKYAHESFCNGEERTYHAGANDSKSLSTLYEEEMFIMLISYHEQGHHGGDSPDDCQIDRIYIGEAIIKKQISNMEKVDIVYEMKRCIKKAPMIINILDDLELELDSDYSKKSYVLINKSEMLSKLIAELLLNTVNGSIRKNYTDLESNYEMHKYAQHNNQCIRLYGFLAEQEYRNEFQRDRERIVNSKAFRRLVDKAQIFSAEKGDHYRTRMTHTLEVNQISKAIAFALGLNLDLTEAIALGHDIGHTPFGHQGERTLYNILSEEARDICKIDEKIFTPTLLGGFKHNYQSVRVLSFIEEKYCEHQGLDISVQTLEGILKHTGLKHAEINEFIDESLIEYLHLELEEDGQPVSSTLEGQVVAIADEIAQRGHDIDDAISSKLITVDELIELLGSEKFSNIRKLIEKERSRINEYNRLVVDEGELLAARIISVIVGYFINDVIQYSRTQIAAYNRQTEYIDRCLINLSPNEGVLACDLLKKVVNKRVIANSEVSLFDYNGSTIVKGLFCSYYNNPRLLHKGTLRKIYIDQLKCDNPEVAGNAIDWANGNISVVTQEINKIHELSENIDSEYFIKKKILIRNIVDYISGMTDSYACHEYERLK